MNSRETHEIELLCWFSKMVGAGAAMPEAEKRELLEWEARNLDGCTVGTSDWPGWKKYVGSRPVFSDEDRAKERFGYVYLVRAESGEHKIGRTKDVGARVRNFMTLAPFKFTLIHSFSADDCRMAERLLHKQFSPKRIKGEWFTLNQKDVTAISKLVKFADGKFAK
jgi:Meiotically up-regulated gene 113